MGKEIVVSQDKKIEWIKLKIDEEMQKEPIKQSLSDKTSDRDCFIDKNRIITAVAPVVIVQINIF